MQMLRCLFFIEAQFQFKTVATHVPGVDNELADDLSRDKLTSFLTKKKDADHLSRPRTGPLPAGRSGSLLLFEGCSRLHPQDIPIGAPQVCKLLFIISPFPCSV